MQYVILNTGFTTHAERCILQSGEGISWQRFITYLDADIKLGRCHHLSQLIVFYSSMDLSKQLVMNEKLATFCAKRKNVTPQLLHRLLLLGAQVPNTAIETIVPRLASLKAIEVCLVQPMPAIVAILSGNVSYMHTLRSNAVKLLKVHPNGFALPPRTIQRRLRGARNTRVCHRAGLCTLPHTIVNRIVNMLSCIQSVTRIEDLLVTHSTFRKSREICSPQYKMLMYLIFMRSNWFIQA